MLESQVSQAQPFVTRTSSPNPFKSGRALAFGLMSWVVFCARAGLGQTAFFDFNTPGQYTSNFNPWQDNAGVNGGNYSFEESTTGGVGGGGDVSGFRSVDTT